ncbi:MAG: hypothetical protein CVU65_04170 [Deltaproteobacteria bacterium HGW-Deltaproteobacteria-22]|nr:MAG: hypothetical protein CVU65_04170 [Deltaproteobacteria bacterium HGW-Deltaproteobacteria-22]
MPAGPELPEVLQVGDPVQAPSLDAGLAHAQQLDDGRDVLLVDQMLEPIIMGPKGLRKQGTVMLRKVEA